ncbi:MAG: DUF2541 domain-containing protein [Pseudomonadota bacterium]
MQSFKGAFFVAVSSVFALSTLITIASDVAKAQNSEADAKRNGEWRQIATTEVNVKRATSTIDLSKVPGKFRAFAISSGGSLFTVRRARFTYSDGRVHTERRNIRLRPGLRSKPIDRSKTGRFVDKALLTFRVGRGGRGYREVEIWGLQTPQDFAARRDGSTVVADTSTEKTLGTNAVGATPALAGTAIATPGNAVRDDVAGQAEIKTAELTPPPPVPDLPPPLPSRVVPSDTSPAGDVLLGAQSIGFDIGQDLIRVSSKVGKFSRVRLRVLDQDVNVKAIKVTYVGGLSEGFPVNALIRPQRKSAWFPVKSNRFIDRIELSYKKRPSSASRARIEVFGKHADGWLGPDGEGRRYNDGWVLLAAQTAGFVGFDNDDITVGANRGGFDKIRVAVRERAITLNKIKVIYDDGETDVIPVKTRVDAGSTYGPISLREGGQKIEKIQALYRSRYVDKSAKTFGSAIVEFWAKH